MPSVAFDEVVDALLAIQSDAGGEGKQRRVQELLVGLLRRAGDEEEMWALLRVLLPAEDRDSVYGMKTRGLMRTMTEVLERGGYSQEAALLKAWTPVPCRSRRVRGAVVSAPEIAIAAAAARAEADGGERRQSTTTVREVVTGTCDALTAAFLFHDGCAETRVEVLLRLLQEVRLGFNGWLVLVHVLLKRVPLGLATVLSALSAAFPEELRSPVALYSRQRSLRVLAAHASRNTHHRQSQQQQQQLKEIELQCGVPFRPMTADALRAPYLLKWSFSKEERLRRPITPVEGRLVINASTRRWFVPLVSVVRGGGLTMVNLEDERVVTVKSAQRRRHMLLLREFKRAGLIHEEAAGGRVLHYSLSVEEEDNGGLVVMLLRAAPTVADSGGVELLSEDDELAALEPAVEEEGEEEVLRRLLLKRHHREEDRSVIGFATTPGQRQRLTPLRLQVVIAPRAPPKKKRKPTTAAQKKPQKKKEEEEEEATQTTTRRQTRSSQKKVEQEEAKPTTTATTMMMIAQVKLDGDRLQAHIVSEGKVSLFTKNGFDVTELYSDVTKELAVRMKGAEPCILDGELLVVDEKDGRALPWDSAKWRYNNSKSGGSKTVEEWVILQQQEGSSGETLLALEYTENEHHGQSWEETVDSSSVPEAVTFMTTSSATRWCGPAARSERRAHRVEGGRLRFVAFDVLMGEGHDLTAHGCAARLEYLERRVAPLLHSGRHVGVIEDTHRIGRAGELVELLREGVRLGLEGYVLKDPEAPYTFDRSNSSSMQKVKLAGPDINTAVVGVGFSLATNPRRWGLATAVKTSSSSVVGVVEYYCRTEVLEGDRTYRAFELIHALATKVSVRSIRRLLLQQHKRTTTTTKKEIELNADYRVKVGGGEDVMTMVEVTWEARSARNAQHNGTLRLPRAVVMTSDLDWLCSPWECPFGLSLRGDLRPLEGWVPRHPVGRPELVTLHGTGARGWDTRASAQTKFEAAAEVRRCVELHTLRRMMRLRASPPERARIEEAVRIASAWGGEEDEAWPKLPPSSKLATPNELSKLLVDAGERLVRRLGMEREVRLAFRPLDMEERKVVAGLPPRSLWPSQHQQQQGILDMEEEAEEVGDRLDADAHRGELLARLRTFEQQGLDRGAVVAPMKFVDEKATATGARWRAEEEETPVLRCPLLLLPVQEEDEEEEIGLIVAGQGGEEASPTSTIMIKLTHFDYAEG